MMGNGAVGDRTFPGMNRHISQKPAQRRLDAYPQKLLEVSNVQDILDRTAKNNFK